MTCRIAPFRTFTLGRQHRAIAETGANGPSVIVQGFFFGAVAQLTAIGQRFGGTLVGTSVCLDRFRLFEIIGEQR